LRDADAGVTKDGLALGAARQNIRAAFESGKNRNAQKGTFPMTELNRRRQLAGAAALGAASFSRLGTTAANAAPQSGHPGAGLLPLQGRRLRMHLDQ
jgi:hypothetical protein